MPFRRQLGMRLGVEIVTAVDIGDSFGSEIMLETGVIEEKVEFFKSEDEIAPARRSPSARCRASPRDLARREGSTRCGSRSRMQPDEKQHEIAISKPTDRGSNVPAVGFIRVTVASATHGGNFT
eukprot:272932-Pleurochrysis_carterae.AAC.2